VKSRIFQPSDTLGVWYINGNYVEGNPTVSNDNWAGGVNPSIAVKDINNIKSSVPFGCLPVTTRTPQQAFDLVLQFAGAILPKRDTVDGRIVYETRNGIVTYGGRTYAKAQGFDTARVYGIIDSQTDVGGWPLLNSLPAPVDNDHDGMPDEWELAHHLSPNDASDRNLIGANGYTMLEVYLNELAGSNPSTTTDIEDQNNLPLQFSLEQCYPNPFNPTTTIRYSLPVDERVSLIVYDLLGRKVAVLIDGDQSAGVHSVVFVASHLPSGFYTYSLQTSLQRESKRMVLLR
jgi:hypothetical protein